MKTMIVDIGSNTIKYDIFDKNSPISVGHRSVAAGIIRYIENGVLSEAGLDKLLEILLAYKADADQLGTQMHVFATASLRRISNPQAVIEKIKQRVDISIDLISGERESELSLCGMLAVTPHEDRGLMMDMGGGSTELNFFQNEASAFSVSCPFGALSLKNDFVKELYPDPAQARSIYDHAKSVFGTYEKQIQTETLYMVGGSAKAVAKLLLHKNGINSACNIQFDREDFIQLAKRMIPCENEDQMLLQALFPDRHHVMLPALCAYVALLDTCHAKQICVSKGGIREGYFIQTRQKIEER